MLALGLRLDGFGRLDAYLPHLVMFTAISGVLKFSSLWKFRLYRRYWRYASVDELILIVAAVAVAGLAAWLVYFGSVALDVVSEGPRLPWSVPIVDAILTLLFVGGTRFSSRAAEHVRQRLQGKPGGQPVIIIGAGDAGSMIAKELYANPQLELDPIGFIDDNPLKKNRTILGLPILGDRNEIPRVAERYHVTTAIIAMPKVPGKVLRQIREICDQAGLKVKTIPGVYDIISGRVKVSQLRDVEIEDLLRREPVVTDEAGAARLVRGKTVLVTGAGGSIGSEICRQVARLGSKKLILLGHAENPIFDIHNELVARYPAVAAFPVIADIRDAARIDGIFERFRPHVVFHAAAHKHVPLMEVNPEEAITNNVRGTYNVVRSAEKVAVERFVSISTDKAVNPANIMGMTKLLAERVVHDAWRRSGKIFVSVRFGNVLASRGSVIPLFRKQIEAGGPVTVTHPDIVRYFMTIPEAVLLVLQAATMGTGGEIFVLDMGDPLRIVDLARDLIELSGLEVGKDIDIVFIGLRRGEKMSEQLFDSAEQHARTAHQKIFVARNGQQPSVEHDDLVELEEAAGKGERAAIDRLRAMLGAEEGHLPVGVSHESSA